MYIFEYMNAMHVHEDTDYRALKSARGAAQPRGVLCTCLTTALLMLSCTTDEEGVPDDYRQSMRDFVQNLSAWAKTRKSGFLVIPQNGQELLTANGEADGAVVSAYVGAIDGVGREDLFYGYTADNVATPASERDYMISFLDLAKQNGLAVLVTDYCSSPGNITDSYVRNHAKGYLSYAAVSRELDVLPPGNPYNANTENITTLNDAQNFLYYIHPTGISRNTYINQLSQTMYDILLIDAFFDSTMLTKTEVDYLKHQAGRERLVIAYMSIGEAEDYRYYWQESWARNPPSWLAEENPDWEGNYKVRYWEKEWQDIIFGSDGSYLGRIINAGFDGVYLDIIDAFEYFE